MYTILMGLPKKYTVKPHRHSEVELMMVVLGALNVGIGKDVNVENTVHLPLHGTVIIPANMPHYAWTTEPMIMQITAMGPRDVHFV
jgi:cupin superfamily acireductone dioxygenase involved in methionine salvage